MEHGHSPKPPSMPTQPLFLGLDLSTQQLKVLVLEQRDNITNNDDDDGLRTHSSFAIHLDSELPHYRTQGGVHAHAQQGSGVVTAPVLMWVEALERVFEKMKGAGFPFHRVVSISGAAQQHGSVYWSSGATKAFEALRGPSSESLSSGLVETFKDAFTVEESPIWQDTSTMSQCEEMEAFLGKVEKRRRERSGATTTTTVADAAVGEEEAKEVRRLGQQRLAELTGSRAYERYTGSQILKIVQKSPEVYRSTTRISLVSSFLASLLIANYAAIDVADGSGMNLLDIRTKTWDPALTRFIDQDGRVEESTTAAEVSNSLEDKLGEVDASGTKIQGVLSSWFVSRYGFSSDVKVVTFTGDNPATVMALRAERGDAMVSLGTSDTLLLYTDTHAFISPSGNDNSTTATDKGEQDANSSVAKLLSVGYLCHPVDPNGYLMLYCAKNGSLAREQVRDMYADSNWDRFDQYLREGTEESGGSGVGFYYFDREIWPPVQGVYRFENGVAVDEFGEQDANANDSAKRAAANVVAICESQFLAMRIRSSQKEDATSSSSLNSPGISRILATGGASSNRVLLQLLANVFGVPVVSMGTDDQQPGAGSAAWGAARKAYLYGRQGDVGGISRQDADRDSGMRTNSERSTAILPDLAQTKKYVGRISEFLRLEASLL